MVKVTPRFIILVLGITALVTASAAIVYAWLYNNQHYAVRVGILYSETGAMATNELPIIDALLMGIEEINNSGGVLGKSIEPIIADGASDPITFGNQAEKLITERKVDVIFGCWTSASRKRVKPIVEKYDNLLFYPLQYEGLENSANIIYTGAAANQQLLPGITWCYFNIGNSFFLVGSDYVFPRTANVVIKNYIDAFDITIVGEVYHPLSSMDFTDTVQKILKAQPKVIINTLNGNSNVAFFAELKKAGITAQKIPVMSFSIAEEELRTTLKNQDLTGNYATWSYFQSVNTPESIQFVEKFKKKYGQHRVVSDPMEAAYFGVHLWAQAVKYAKLLIPQSLKIKPKNKD